ncbi:CRISPR-associated endoribonuclease Cas6 [Rufibacter psychrotolerans]|uniref:CRISPR-associated endoribonuclease Cas6 n=1 Tax=Rufibacter psychrotolerans TaxID=2812556 RepID=UPI0019678281|nr:CRISPR-associated endoribonuclease Cas6 [Rufibacter sp. SYSU D00308]
MRIQLKLSPNTQQVPFNHLYELTLRLHRWLGPDNALHDGLSLYSFGWLRGGKAQRGALSFPAGATWQISFHSEEATRKLLMGIINEPELFYGMRVYEVQELPTPAFGEQYRFLADGPVIARQVRPDGTREYLLHDSPAADVALTATLRHKLEKAGLSSEGVSVAFDRDFLAPRHKLMEIKGIQHKGSLCPVLVQGPPEAVQFAWLVGAGELTGSGFGALM